MPIPGKRFVVGDAPPPARQDPVLGHVLAFLTAVITGIAFIAAKPVLGYLDPLSFSMAQFGTASVFSFVWLVLHRGLPQIARLSPRHWTFLVVVSLLFLSATYTMWIGLSMIPATSASLLNRLEVLVTVLLGMALLGERLSLREAGGAIVMFLGVVILRYQAPPEFSAGFWMMVLSSTLFGMTEVLVKTRVHTIPPDVFVFARNFMVFLFSLFFALWRMTMKDGTWLEGLVDLPGIRRGLPLIAVAAISGPFVARTLYTYSIRHLRLGRVAIINQSQPFFVALFSAILFLTLPSRREWMGGLLIIAGALVLVHWREGMAWWMHRRRNEPSA